MPAIESKLDPQGEVFQRNRAHMLRLVERLRALEARAREASAKAKSLFDKRGQLLPRERLARLLDAGAPWLELSSLAGIAAGAEELRKVVRSRRLQIDGRRLGGGRPHVQGRWLDAPRRCDSVVTDLAGELVPAALAAVAKKIPEIREGSRVLTFCYDTGERYLSIDELFH